MVDLKPAVVPFILTELRGALYLLNKGSPSDEDVAHAANTLAFALIEGNLVDHMADHWRNSLATVLGERAALDPQDRRCAHQYCCERVFGHPGELCGDCQKHPTDAASCEGCSIAF